MSRRHRWKLDGVERQVLLKKKEKEPDEQNESF